MTDVATTRLPMACDCGDDRKREMLEMRTRACHILQLGSERHLSTNILYALNAWYSPGWDLTRVAVDMWMGLTVAQWDDGRAIYTTCDTFEDGLAQIFLHIYDNYAQDE